MTTRRSPSRLGKRPPRARLRWHPATRNQAGTRNSRHVEATLLGGLSLVERFNAAHVEPCPRLSPSLPRASPGVRTPADLGPPRATGAPWLASALPMGSPCRPPLGIPYRT